MKSRSLLVWIRSLLVRVRSLLVRARSLLVRVRRLLVRVKAVGSGHKPVVWGKYLLIDDTNLLFLFKSLERWARYYVNTGKKALVKARSLLVRVGRLLVRVKPVGSGHKPVVWGKYLLIDDTNLLFLFKSL